MARAAKAPRRLLIVDGYNVINARRGAVSGAPGTAEASYSLADAREKLISELMDYAGYSDQQVVLVFDAWMSDRDRRTEEKRGAVTVVYTQKGEIADRYIERLCDGLAADIELHRLEVRVASSDALEQTIVLGRGASRMSSRELMFEMGQMREAGIRQAALKPVSRANPIGERLSEDVRRRLDELRKTREREKGKGNPG